MPTTTFQPRKQPRQVRSAATVAVILEAAARVLTAESLAGFNTNRVAHVAGVSVGSLYQYFPNKDGLVAALIEREQATLGSAVQAALAQTHGLPLAGVLAALVDVAIQHQFGNPVYAAALDHEEQRLPIQALLGAAQRDIARSLARVLRQHRAVLASRLPATAAADCLVITKALIENEPQHAPPKLKQLKQKVLRALLGYLQGDANQPRTKLKLSSEQH